MCNLKWQWDCYESIARIRLVKTEKPSACVTAQISDSAVLPVVPSCVNKMSKNPVIQSRIRFRVSHAKTLMHVTI
jgi:hypothetical protein